MDMVFSFAPHLGMFPIEKQWLNLKKIVSPMETIKVAKRKDPCR